MDPALSPGVYVERGNERRQPLMGAPDGGCIFLGRATNSEPGIPYRVDSWREFVDRHGDTGVTPQAIHGFFANGGQRAWLLSLGPPSQPIQPAEFIQLIDALERLPLEGVEEPELIVAPELATLSGDGMNVEAILHMQHALVSHCENLGTRMVLLDAPEVRGVKDILQWRQRFDSSFVALLAPWLLPLDGGRPVPASGHVAGIWARCAREEGVHRAPANLPLDDVVGTLPEFDRSDQRALLNEEICTIRGSAMRGVRVFGSRSPSSSGVEQLNVRRLLIHIRRSIDAWADWITFEPNAPALWQVLCRSIDGFLAELWRRGALVGDRPEDAWFVRCDEETNPPELRERGMLQIDIGVAPVRPAEFIVVRVHRRTQEGVPQAHLDPTTGGSS